MSLRVPKYRLHRGSGQALVQIDSRRIYLGKHGSEESREKYRRIVAEWLSAQRSQPASPPDRDFHAELTINEVLLAYWQYAKSY